MEAIKERESATGTLLDTILPPRLEDAGLEDCALPPESIKKAFFKAATAVRSRATPLFTTENEEDRPHCVNDPRPTAKDVTDEVVAGEGSPLPESDALEVGDSPLPRPEESGPCAVEKNSGVVVGGGSGCGGVADMEEKEGCIGDGSKGSKD